MSTIAAKLRAIKEKIDSNRSAMNKDIWVLHGNLEAIKQIGADESTRSIAEAARFYCEWMGTELESQTTEVLELLEAIVEEAGGRRE
jgi:hypothetical protein